MKQIIHILSLILLLGACTDESYTGPLSGGSEPGAPVPVKLTWSIQPMQSPLSSGTKAGSGHAVSSTQVCKGMEISLEEIPVTRASIEDEIKNFMVFQFNGTTLESTLVRKDYYSNSSVENVQLNNSVVKNRIIVIANASQETFATITVGSTLDDFNKLGITYNEESPGHFPLFNVAPSGRIMFAGSTDMIVSANKQADIMLYRTVARVRIDLFIVTDMQNKGYTNWTCQFMNIPKKSFYHSIGHTAVFPVANVRYANYKSDVIPAFSLNIEKYLPVNLQHPVPFTTPEKRGTNAPAGATYLQIMGVEVTNGTISKSVVYQVHLGSNFANDYSVSPNYTYKYTIRITGENDDDSRVVKFIPGYFGGDLKTYGQDGTPVTNQTKAVTWRYEKRIEVYVKDLGPKVWLSSAGGASMPGGGNSFIDGRANTWALNQAGIEQYPAVKECIGLNSTPLTEESLVWYMPSYGQSLGIYVAGSNTLKSLSSGTYWTSSTDGTNAWGTKVWTGQSIGGGPTSVSTLRCIKDLEGSNVIH